VKTAGLCAGEEPVARRFLDFPDSSLRGF